MEQKTREIIDYRIKKAKDTLAEMEVFIENSLWNTSVNRLYYSCFWAVTALLLKSGLSSKTHAGTKQLFGLHFIVPGIVPKEMGALFSELFDMRQSSDYEDCIEYEKEDVLPLLEPATAFINKIAELLAA